MVPTPRPKSVERSGKAVLFEHTRAKEDFYNKLLDKLVDHNSQLSREREMWKNRAFWGLIMAGAGFSFASILCTALDGWAGGVLFGVMAVYCGYAAMKAA